MLYRSLVPGKKRFLVWKHVYRRITTGIPLKNFGGNNSEKSIIKVSKLVDGSEAAQQEFGDLVVLPDFISEEDEAAIIQEVDFGFRRSKYQYSHWDGVSCYVLK